MLPGLLSLVIHSVFTVGCAIKASRCRHKLSPMTGMMIAMSLATMSSLAWGFVLGAQLHELRIPTVSSVLYGLLVGYWSGRPFGLMVALNGMVGGVMGGMMGAMLGGMLPGSTSVMIVFVDMVAIFLYLVLNQAIQEEVHVEKRANRLGNAGFFVLAVGIAVVALLFQLRDGEQLRDGQPAEITQNTGTHVHHMP